MDQFPEVLTDKELTLRPLALADLTAITSQLNDERVAPWLAAVSRPFDPSVLLEHDQHPGEHVRAIVQSGQILGGLCIGSTLWYWLAPDHWGQGHMRRALMLALSARFRHAAPPLTATCRQTNDASRALLLRLGFAQHPAPRCLFFHGTERSEPCHDFVLAPEQWHLLHPPIIPAGSATLRPAVQKDAPTLELIFQRQREDIWPIASCLSIFIETHRFRGGVQGLFVVIDDIRRTIGAALIDDGGTHLCFLEDGDSERHRNSVAKALSALE